MCFAVGLIQNEPIPIREKAENKKACLTDQAGTSTFIKAKCGGYEE